MTMKPGDSRSLDGYDRVAAAMVFDGGGPPFQQWLVLVHNHSTHYLLFWATMQDSSIGTFVESFLYREDDLGLVYAQALTRMVQLALSH